jgi:hypothetical protein
MAVIDRYGVDNHIVRISQRKGGIVGDIGFYFVELKSGSYVMIPDDARLYPWLNTDESVKVKFLPNGQKNVTFLDYFSSFYRNLALYPSINNTFALQIKTIANKIIFKKNNNQLFWGEYVYFELN